VNRRIGRCFALAAATALTVSLATACSSSGGSGGKYDTLKTDALKVAFRPDDKPISFVDNGKPAGLEANIGKMMASPHGQRLSDLAKRSQGPAGMIGNPDVLPLPDRSYGLFSNWDYSYWFAPAATLGVGTQEILKNSVAERVLGLPRDVDATAGVPFNEVGRPQLKSAS